MGAGPIRIISDLHFGEHASRLRSLDQLQPLLQGIGGLILNGDTFDNRSGVNPPRTEAIRREVLRFFGSLGVPVTFVTGNHDPHLTQNHFADLAGGRVFLTHGDILFDSITPWSKDAAAIRAKVVSALASAQGADPLVARLGAFRSVAAGLRQRHQSEPNPFLYLFSIASDTVWPPTRALAILRSWAQAPGRAEALARGCRPAARFVLIGHTHRPGVWRMPSGVVVINTGSFCRPFGALAVDIDSGSLRVVSVERSGGRFRPGPEIARFPL